MKIFALGVRFCPWFAGLMLSGFAAYAQMPGGAGPAGMSAALTKLFGTTTAFAAKGEMQVTDAAHNEVAFWPMDFAILDRRIRVKIDLAETRNKDMPPGTGATLKKIGMSEVVSIIRPDKKVLYVIYPDQRVMLAMPLPKEDYEGSDKAPQVSKTPLGKEIIDGHPCVKNRVLISDSAGQTAEAITWDATDLKNLPIQIETQEKDPTSPQGNTTSLVRFKQIQFARPDAALFEPPSGYTQYNNAEDLKLGVMKKMMDSAAKK
jgi:hypothetical protein